MKYDFSGYATRNDLKCTDGRTIKAGAFKDCSGKKVPLVWQHQHNEVGNVLGYAILEDRPDGVYAYGVFNNTDQAKQAKEYVQHGDIESLSIYANGLKQHKGDVMHGSIKEVSLVIAGANPGAFIDFVSLEHSEDGESEAVIYYDEKIDHLEGDTESEEEIAHSDDAEGEPEMGDTDTVEHADNSGKTVGEIYEAMTEEQQNVSKIMAVAIAEEMVNGQSGENDDEEDNDEVKHSEGELEMARNLFESGSGAYVGADDQVALTHAQIDTIFEDAKNSKVGTLKNSFLMHAEDYGIKDIDWLFPEAKTFQDKPEFISRKMDWVSTVMGGVHRSPFSRVKSVFADITADEARAKGYIKGDLKENEVFTLLRRTTEPCTIYKRQQLDRDDVIDITDFDVVAWIKAEMRMMLDEEIARAILVGDGRLTSDRTHIPEDHVRPIWKEADLFCIKKEVTVGADADATSKNFIRAAIKARKDYRGSGNPILFTTEDYLTDMLLLEDSIGHALYETETQLATKLRVSKIVSVPVMENLTRSVTKGGIAYTNTLRGIIVNLSDYNVGADKGGSISFFDDFDIDFNQMKYLIETRISGALTKPFSAIVLETSVQGQG